MFLAALKVIRHWIKQLHTI